MGRKTGIGYQDFEQIIVENNFYVDKTAFIREWWESKDRVTLITRPRRFGKTLNMSMLEKFFSVKYAERGDLFEGLAIWEDEKYQQMQGTYPVVFLSFAGIKENTFLEARKSICRTIEEQYNKNDYLLEGSLLNSREKEFYQEVSANMSDSTAAAALRSLSDFLGRYYDRKVILLLDEYDTPMQEAYVNGYWDEMIEFIRNLFNSAFKTNPYMERAIMTGITRVGRESVFSDLNHLKVVTTTSEQYTESFGFTEKEMFEALDEFGLSDRKEEVKKWYDGFTFGRTADIYNPWSVLNYLAEKKVGAYWANTSSNNLIGKLIQESTRGMKEDFENLLNGGAIHTKLDEQISYNMLDCDEKAIWSLLLASGYMKVKQFESHVLESGDWEMEYDLELTNLEVRGVFRKLVRNWFGKVDSDYNDFIKALLINDVKAMNVYMNRVALATFSYFDTGKNPSETEPKRFYHGFVLGLMVELADRYVLTSNRESGFGRYDVMLEPKNQDDDAMILEFKVQDIEEEKDLQETVDSALAQIEKKKYAEILFAKGIPEEKIRRYGLAFQGKKVRIGTNKM